MEIYLCFSVVTQCDFTGRIAGRKKILIMLQKANYAFQQLTFECILNILFKNHKQGLAVRMGYLHRFQCLIPQKGRHSPRSIYWYYLRSLSPSPFHPVALSAGVVLRRASFLQPHQGGSLSLCIFCLEPNACVTCYSEGNALHQIQLTVSGESEHSSNLCFTA